jgi:hypothetical protein
MYLIIFVVASQAIPRPFRALAKPLAEPPLASPSLAQPNATLAQPPTILSPPRTHLASRIEVALAALVLPARLSFVAQVTLAAPVFPAWLSFVALAAPFVPGPGRLSPPGWTSAAFSSSRDFASGPLILLTLLALPTLVILSPRQTSLLSLSLL